MAYNNNIPLANQQIKNTQQPINDNFAAIKTLVDINHETFDTANQGKHKYVTLTNQGVAPAGLADEWNIYNAITGGAQHVHLRLGAGTAIPITQYQGGASGYVYFPSGLILQWGEGTVNGQGSINFAIPFPSSCWQVIASIQSSTGGDTNRAVRVVSFTVNNATFYVSSRTTTGAASSLLSFFAIGI